MSSILACLPQYLRRIYQENGTKKYNKLNFCSGSASLGLEGE